MSAAKNEDDRWEVRQEDGCLSEFVGGVSWPGAVVALFVALFFLGVEWFDDRDDARLDDLRQSTVRACAERTEGVEAMADCVAVTIEATGQPS